MTRKDRARRSALINELSRLSRTGWKHTTSADWEPLERELASLTSYIKTHQKWAKARREAK